MNPITEAPTMTETNPDLSHPGSSPGRSNGWRGVAIDGPGQTDYVTHTATLRGNVRHRLITRALHRHLPPPPARVLDVGGGNGVQARSLARLGYDVTVVEPDPAMLRAAEGGLAREPGLVRDRIRLVAGDGFAVAELVGRDWDVTLCHGVIMFVPEPERLLAVLAGVTRPGGIISVVGKTAAAWALRAGLQRRWQDVTALLRADAAPESGAAPGAASAASAAQRAASAAAVSAELCRAGTEQLAWYGIRVFTDHLGDEPPGPDLEAIIDAEWEAGLRDPYRRLARLFHVVHRRAAATTPA